MSQCLSGDMLAQVMSKAIWDCLAAIIITPIQVQSQSVTSSTRHAISSSFSSFSSTSFTQTQRDQQQHTAASTGNISITSFVSTFCTYSNPIFGVPSMVSSACSQSLRIGGGVASSFPTISNSAPLVGRDFVIGLATPPFPTNS